MNCFPMKRAFLVLGCLVCSGPVLASTIYKCTDPGGGILISNSKVDKSCRAVVSGADPAPASAPVGAKPRGAAANPSPAGFPKVAEDTQKARDNDRKRILEQEQASEQKNLEQARKELAEQEAIKSPDPTRTVERLQPYRDRVSQHERNLQAIAKELSAIR